MKKLLFILFILVPMLAFSQPIVFQQEQYPFPISFYGVEPQLGFMNADAYYHHDFGDIDGDGDYDILIGGAQGFEHFIKNVGTPDSAIFEYITNQYVPSPDDYMFQPPAFCDIDNDEDLDLFITAFMGYIWFYRNHGTPYSADYVLEDSSFANVSTTGRSTIDFVDIDNDGDFDLFVGAGWSNPSGRIYFYENQGTPEVSNMIYITDYFSAIDVGDDSSPEFCDIDGDDDYDLFVGCEDGTIWFYENIGTPDTFDFEYITNNYNGIDVGNSSVPRFCDIDNDGDFDLFIANESAGYSGGMEGDIAFYRNTGLATAPNWEFVTGQYLFMDMSSCSSPNAVDLNNDGLVELIVGITDGELILFSNVGTLTEPSFCFDDSSYLDLQLSYQPVLSFGDLDADSDLDFVVHKDGFTDYIDIYRNIGTSSEPEYEFWENITSDPDWGYSGVALCDIDDDEDLDLFIGDKFSEVQFWENIGNQSTPNFRLVDDNYFNEPVFGSSRYPFFDDLDHDGDYDLIMGHSYSSGYANHIIFWRNEGSPQIANFIIEDTIMTYEPGTVGTLRPSLADIDGDGDDDLFVGESGGAMLFFRNMEYNSVVGRQSSVVSKFTLRQNYPNPFNSKTVIPFTLDRKIPVKITVYNQLGQVVTTLVDGRMDKGNHLMNWDASDVASGVYLVRLEAGDQSQNVKTILIK